MNLNKKKTKFTVKAWNKGTSFVDGKPAVIKSFSSEAEAKAEQTRLALTPGLHSPSLEEE